MSCDIYISSVPDCRVYGSRVDVFLIKLIRWCLLQTQTVLEVGTFCLSELWNVLLAQHYPVLINAFTEMLDFTPSVLVNIFTVESCNHIHPHIKLLNSHLLHFFNNSYILNYFKTISQVLDISGLSDLFFPSKPKHPTCWCEIHFSNSIYLSLLSPQW